MKRKRCRINTDSCQTGQTNKGGHYEQSNKFSDESYSSCNVENINLHCKCMQLNVNRCQTAERFSTDPKRRSDRVKT